jgi:flagellar hook-length control protein FliK
MVSELAEHARTTSGPRRVVVPLDPPALGHVTVEIVVRADSVKVSLQHADEAAFSALHAQRPAIEAALESNGLQLSDFDVSGNQRQPAPREQRATPSFDLFTTFTEHDEPDGALRL